LYIAGIEFTLRDEDMLSESSDDRRRNGRRKKEKRRHKRLEKEEKEMDEYNKESFKKMKQEIEELRKKEHERERELAYLKNRIEAKEKEKESATSLEIKYIDEFNKDEYLNKGFIESAKWLKNVVAVELTDKIQDEKFKIKFESMAMAKKASIHLGMRTCARFNRGEECNLGRWHMTHKDTLEPIRPKQLWTRHHQQQQFGQGPSRNYETSNVETNSRRNEIRLHACTLCLDTFGAAFGHSVLNCPWILKKNWEKDEEHS